MQTRILILTIVLSATTAFGDIILYDEPQVSAPNSFGYVQVGHKTPPGHGTIDTQSYSTSTPVYVDPHTGVTTYGTGIPYLGIACIEGTLTGGDTANNSNKFSIFFPKFGWINPSEWTALSYYVRQKNQAGGRVNVHAFFGVDSGTDLGVWARVGFTAPVDQYGLDTRNWGPNATYQKITIPMSTWSSPINRFSWDIVNTGSGFYIDFIVLEGNGTIHYPNPYPAAGP